MDQRHRVYVAVVCPARKPHQTKPEAHEKRAYASSEVCSKLFHYFTSIGPLAPQFSQHCHPATLCRLPPGPALK